MSILMSLDQVHRLLLPTHTSCVVKELNSARKSVPPGTYSSIPSEIVHHPDAQKNLNKPHHFVDQCKKHPGDFGKILGKSGSEQKMG